MTFLLVLLFTITESLFTVGARATASYSIEVPREALKNHVDDIDLFARNMPGVVSVTPIGEGRYRYLTEKEIPLSSSLVTEFVILKEQFGDSVTVYRSVRDEDENYMYCRVFVRPRNPTTTEVEIELQVRLRRERASEVHWLAPILGESFISDQMTKDMVEMLEEFIERSNAELLARFAAADGRE